jgi:hypothetical protein
MNIAKRSSDKHPCDLPDSFFGLSFSGKLPGEFWANLKKVVFKGSGDQIKAV